MRRAVWALAGAGAIFGIVAAAKPVAELALTTAKARKAECSFGDFLADALADRAGVTIALVPAVALKPGVIPKGPFSEDDIRRLLQDPDETWAVSRLKGEELRAAIERSLSWLPAGSGSFLQVSGLTITYDPKAPPGARVRRILVLGLPLRDAETYEVAMPSSLAKGGSGYFRIFDAKKIVRQGEPGLAKLAYEFALRLGTVSYTGQGRIVPSG